MDELTEPPRYRAFLIAAWEERRLDPDSVPVWRYSLEDARAGHRRVFATLEEAMLFLQKEIDTGQAGERGR